jgi:anti-anti-sigma factor
MIAEPLRYHVTDHLDRTVIALAGEVDISHVDELRSLLTVTGSRAPWLEVDLSRVGFIDARSISVLLLARSDAVAAGGRLAITNPTGHVRRVLDTIGVLTLLVEDHPSPPVGRRSPLAGCGGTRGAVHRPATTCRPARPVRCVRRQYGNEGHPPGVR